MRFSLLVFLALVLLVCSSAGLAQIYINELVSNPKDDCSDCTEWMEFYNSGDQAVDLNNWTLYKGSGDYAKIGVDVSNASASVPAKGFLAFAVKAKKFGLKNDGDTIKLVDASGAEADKVTYPKLKEEEAYTRFPDGKEFKKAVSTKGLTNGQEEVDVPVIPEVVDTTSNEEIPIEDDTSETTPPVEDIPTEDPVVVKDEILKQVQTKTSEKSTDGESVTGKTIYSSEEKSSITKPLLLLLAGLSIVIIGLQIQLMRTRKDGRENN